MAVRQEPLVYYDEADRKVVDLRPAGVSFVPLASRVICRYTRNSPGLHVHSHLSEIVYCVRGALSFDTPTGSFAFLPGDVFVSGPDEPHSMSICLKGAFVYRILVAWPKGKRRLPGLSAEETELVAGTLGNGSRRRFHGNPRIRGLFDRLFALYGQSSEQPVVRAAQLRICALDLLLECADSALRGTVSVVPPVVRHVIEDICRRPQRKFDFVRLARTAQMTPVRFRDAFKRAVGLPPCAYQMMQRIELAKRMISADPHVSTVTLAMDLGFSSAPHFSAMFKRVSGMSFSHWIKQVKEERC